MSAERDFTDPITLVDLFDFDRGFSSQYWTRDSLSFSQLSEGIKTTGQIDLKDQTDNTCI